MLAIVLGLVFGIMIGFIRTYTSNFEVSERRKMRRVKNFMKQKSKDFLFDRRISGTLSLLLIVGLPQYLSYRSKSPVFFDMYSAKVMFVLSLYVIILLFFLGTFIYVSRKKRKLL